MTIYFASDHGGFELKKFLINELQNQGFRIKDGGPYELNPEDNYPKTTLETIKHIQNNPQDKAILICRNGVGVTIFANRFKGVRAGLSWDANHAKSHMLDDNTNILTLPADYISRETALKVCLEWLNTQFSNERRHVERISQIEDFS